MACMPWVWSKAFRVFSEASLHSFKSFILSCLVCCEKGCKVSDDGE
ncbi:hypothetical protein BAZSYMB_GCONTIG00732_1 [Bathymodiolus azoricus thioautotrophic gill symbiont]|uniref:Uncharacterized protein n=1 Tax=Bathymodiolus azoricus thioautotrophic gill symbiont TaxID=235205 RepID=A0A1H6KM10_9GAMM|nr:hypothetical protein BAZSYMB_GCONTIG00732_1 [Bathymodiolus azoricus thioautotrophic gill symbiont]